MAIPAWLSSKKFGLTVSAQGAAAYEYTLKSNGQLSDYNMEQQGEIVSDYFIICVIGNPRGVWNQRNYTKSPQLLVSTLQGFLENPASKANLPA